jgi:hypothetical protein
MNRLNETSVKKLIAGVIEAAAECAADPKDDFAAALEVPSSIFKAIAAFPFDGCWGKAARFLSDGLRKSDRLDSALRNKGPVC